VLENAFGLSGTLELSFCCLMLGLRNKHIFQVFGGDLNAHWLIFGDARVRWIGGSFWKKKIGFGWIGPKG